MPEFFGIVLSFHWGSNSILDPSAPAKSNLTTPPLNINTGNHRHKCYYYLDIDIFNILGIFTVPMSGVWRVTFSMMAGMITGHDNRAFLFINGDQVDESLYYTYSQTGLMHSTGGRELSREFNQGDTIELRATGMDGYYFYINYCAEYVPKM